MAGLIELNFINHLAEIRRRQEEQQRKRKPRFIKFNEIVDGIEDDKFFKTFRMKKIHVINFVKLIESEIMFKTERNNPVPTLIQFLVALGYYRMTTQQIVEGHMFQISQSSVSRIVKRVSIAISRLFNSFIRCPSTHAFIQEVSYGFYQMHAFPNVIGCIDCTHVKVTVPEKFIINKERFRNRKNEITINVQAICDHRMRFIDLVIRWPGSTHDSRIFRESLICMRLDRYEFRNYWLLGDSGYALRRYLMTPLRDPKTKAEKMYNESHIKTRCIIERTFGGWKRKFPILKKGLLTRLDTSLLIIDACGVLWNYCKKVNACDDGSDDSDKGDDSDNDYEEETDPLADRQATQQGNAVRNRIINHFSGRGQGQGLS